MTDFIIFMHNDAEAGGGAHDWSAYLSQLRAAGVFQGGSAIGDGACMRKGGATPPVTAHLTGYIRVTAPSLADARALLAGNPVYETGGTIEIRELPRDD